MALDPTLTVLMVGPNHALLLDEEAEIVIEDAVFKLGHWLDRVTNGWPTRDQPTEEEC